MLIFMKKLIAGMAMLAVLGVRRRPYISRETCKGGDGASRLTGVPD
ncbi:hypothetical protein ACFTAO_12095 [Paenibacillus rhizoplanae]